MEISAIEALTNANLEVDRALDNADKTLHRLWEEISVESEAVAKAAELKSRDKRVYTETYGSEADQRQVGAETTQGTIRTESFQGIREGRRRLRQHDDDSISENALPCNQSQKRRLHSVHGRRENRLSQRALKDRSKIFGRPPPEWRPVALDRNKGTVIWKLLKSLCGL